MARGRAASFSFLDRRLALYRDGSGVVRALDARCPHLGADLGRGAVLGDRLRCEFHHWAFDGEGRCVAAPGAPCLPEARALTYPALERWGAVWVFNGPAPLFEPPSFEGFGEGELAVSLLKPRTLRCHPHVVACNGLDVQHFRAVHRLDFADPPRLSQPDRYRTRLDMTLRIRGHNAFERALRLVSGPTVSAAFTTWGGNLATIEGRVGRLPLLVLFSHRPRADGGSFSQTFFLAPRRLVVDRLAVAAAKAVMYYLLADDGQIFDTVRFQANLVDSDAALGAFIRQVDELPVYPAASGR